MKVREHPVLGPYVEGLTKLVVEKRQDIETLMDEGAPSFPLSPFPLRRRALSRCACLSRFTCRRRQQSAHGGVDQHERDLLALARRVFRHFHAKALCELKTTREKTGSALRKKESSTSLPTNHDETAALKDPPPTTPD